MSSREETLAKIEAGEDADGAIRDAAPEVQADKAVVLTAVAKDGLPAARQCGAPWRQGCPNP